jgi:hypothetical protein
MGGAASLATPASSATPAATLQQEPREELRENASPSFVPDADAEESARQAGDDDVDHGDDNRKQHGMQGAGPLSAAQSTGYSAATYAAVRTPMLRNRAQ